MRGSCRHQKLLHNTGERGEVQLNPIKDKTAAGRVWWLRVCCRNAVSLQSAWPPRAPCMQEGGDGVQIPLL